MNNSFSGTRLIVLRLAFAAMVLTGCSTTMHSTSVELANVGASEGVVIGSAFVTIKQPSPERESPQKWFNPDFPLDLYCERSIC